MSVRTGEATFVTKEWLEEFLTKCEKRPVTVVDFQVRKGCAENDGFLSALHACSVVVRVGDDKGAGDREEKYELMLKSLSASPQMRQFMIDSGWHQAEVTFYASLVPFLEDFIKKNAKEPYSLPVPKCLGSTFSHTVFKPEEELPGKEDVIIMQNMKRDSKGWFQIPSMEGLSEEAMKLSFKSLAKVHAVPLAMRAKAGLKSVAEVIPCWEEARFDAQTLEEHLLGGFRELEAFLREKRPSWQPGDDWENLKYMIDFSVKNRPAMRLETVCHDDVWNGNLMFCRDEVGSLADCLVIDWQLLAATTPALDVCDVFQFCTRYVSDEERDRLFRIYWDELAAALGNFDIDGGQLKRHNEEPINHLLYTIVHLVDLEKDLLYSWSDFLHDLPVAVSTAAINWVCSMEMMFALGCDEMDQRVLSWYDYFSSQNWKAILADWKDSV